MALVIFYLLAWLLALVLLLCADIMGIIPARVAQHSLAYQCAVVSGMGGLIYCLRSMYLNRCVPGRQWDGKWAVWYYLRPIVSTMMGLVAYIFLNAGGKILDMERVSDSTAYGFLAISFIAGYNVDGFLTKVEQFAKSAWGVNSSRDSDKEDKRNEVNNS